MRSTWTEAVAASTAPAAARPKLPRARIKRHTIQRRSSLRRAWRGASRRPSSCRPLRRTTRPLQWRSWTRPASFTPGLMPLALMSDSATRPHVSPSSASSPTSPTYHFLCRDCAQTCGWSGGEGRRHAGRLRGRGQGRGGWLSALSAAASEVHQTWSQGARAGGS
jgi:hypothetical protein